MDVTVTNAPDERRYEARVDGELAGFAAYLTKDDLVTFTHTEVFSAYEGKGIAGTLVREALDDVRAEGRAVRPVCPFVKRYIERHLDEYGGLVRPSARGSD